MRQCILLFPAHGHAPYLLGSRIARDCDCDIVIPEFYGKIQQQILREEFPDYVNRIFLSAELGKILKPALRDASGPVSLDSYVELLFTKMEKIERNLANYLSKKIELESLGGQKKVINGFTAAINCGLPVSSHINPTFFVFTGKMSNIYRYSDFQSKNTIWLTNLWSKLETTFNNIFVPKLNALSYLNSDDDGVTYTPPLTKPYSFDNSTIPEKSILVVPSGTRLNINNLVRISKYSKIPFVTLSNAPHQLDLPRFNSIIWGNPNIVGVIARAGWGTIWQCLINRKPIGTILVHPSEDPEIAHNIKTIEWSGIGVLLNESVDPLVEHLNLYSRNIENILLNSFEEFGTNDGIIFISNKINVSLNS